MPGQVHCNLTVCLYFSLVGLLVLLFKKCLEDPRRDYRALAEPICEYLCCVWPVLECASWNSWGRGMARQGEQTGTNTYLSYGKLSSVGMGLMGKTSQEGWRGIRKKINMHPDNM